MLRGLRRLSLVDRLAVLYAVAYGVWQLVRTPGSPASIAVGTFAFLPLGLAVASADWRNSREAGLDPRTRNAWILLALSALALWISGNAWAVFVAPGGSPTEPGRLDVIELAHNLCAAAAYLAFPGRWPGRGHRVRFFFDVGLTTVAGFVLAFQFGARTTLTEQGGFQVDLNLLSWPIDWALFVIAAVGLLHKRDSTTRAVMGLLLASSTAYLFANYALYFDSSYHAGDPVDALWFAAWGFRWAAARVAAARYRAAPHQTLAETDVQTQAYQNAAFSFAMVAGAFMLLIGHVLWGDRQFLGLLTIATLLMAGLLVVRQVVDLRENRRLFARQIAQEARFRLLIQGSSDVVVVVDPLATISYVSPSAERLYGADCAIRVGARAGDLLAPEDRPVLRRLFDSDATTHRPLPARVEVSKGKVREVELVWSDLRSDPVVRGVVVNCRDVTERNELERQLRHAQRLDEVGLLAGGLAHDFNNILMAIRGYSELLRTDLSTPERAREDLTHVEEAVDRAATVTRKLLALSRDQPVQPRVVDVNAVTRGLMPLFRQLVTDRIEVSLELEPALWPVMADPGQIEQVLLNLATNARDAMPGGGRLRICTENRTLDGQTATAGDPQPGDYAAIIVSDEGHGMSPDVQDRIFEPFFSTKGRERGIGLGLAMVMRIVVSLDGGIRVDSRPGRGSSFTILLPRTAPERRAAAAPAAVMHAGDRAAPGEAGPRRTILLVEDEAAVRTIARRLLQREGYVVLEAETGEQALDLAADLAQSVDLLLTDLVMPGLHGSELIARFRDAHPTVPVICMTGLAGDMSAQDDGSSWTILAKPFSSEQLMRAVAAALARRPSSPA